MEANFRLSCYKAKTLKYIFYEKALYSRQNNIYRKGELDFLNGPKHFYEHLQMLSKNGERESDSEGDTE